MRACSLALLMVVSSAAQAGELKLIAEFPDLPRTGFRKVSAQRYVEIGVEWDRDEKQRPLMPRYQVFDLQERKVVVVAVPLHQRSKEHLELFGPYAPATFLHYDGQVSTLTFTVSKDYKPVATYLTQFDHRTAKFSDPVEVWPWSAERVPWDIGIDPTDTYFYFALATGPRDEGPRRYTKLELRRLNLKTRAVEPLMTVELPKRKTPLLLNPARVFNRDGTKLAFAEYNDRGEQRKHPPVPTQQAFVIDLVAGTVDAYPAPLTAYGMFFTHDDRHLVLGSNETGEILRVDLKKKKVDAKAKGKTHLQSFVQTPSGKSFLAFSNTLLVSPKVVEVRRVSDLKIQTSIPVRMLFPGNDGVTGGGTVGLDGRVLMLPYVDSKGWPTKKGLRLYEIPDDVDSPTVAGSSAAQLRVAEGIIRGKSYADANEIRYAEIHESSDATFAQFSVGSGGEVCLTGILSGNSDGDYQEGRTRPVVALLDAKGKPRWKQLPLKPGFVDYQSTAVALTADGGCIAHIRAHRTGGAAGTSWVVKVDRAGKVQWDHLFLRKGGTPVAHQLELEPDGAVKVAGLIQYLPDTTTYGWKATLSPGGKLVSEEYEK